MERECDIEAWLRKRTAGLGGAFLKFVSPGWDGAPDRICLMPDGRVIFVELKTSVGKLAKIQKYQIARLRDLGQAVCIVYGDEGARRFYEDLRLGEAPARVYDAEGSYEI